MNKYAIAIVAEKSSDVYINITIVNAMNKFEAEGKALKIGSKLYPDKSIHLKSIEINEQNTVTDTFNFDGKEYRLND